jgi:flagellar hook protein FlgE
MSINSAMLAGVSGLVANSASLSAISDNIANANTVGYKREQTDFSTIVTGSAVKGSYSAGGVISKTAQKISAQGVPQQTTSNTDLSISGQGFFVTTTQPLNVGANDARLFTRAGSFQVDDQGFLKNSAGLYLQGWVADQNGAIQTNATDLSQLKTMNISAVGGVATPTTLISLGGNLQAGAPLSAAAQAVLAVPPTGAYNALTNNMTSYDPVTGVGVKPDYTIQASVSDTQGGRHTIEVALLRSAQAPNTWYAEVHAVPSTDIIGGAATGQLASGQIVFTEDGKLDLTPVTGTSAIFAANNGAPSFTIGASSDPAGAPQWDPALGLGNQTFSVDLNSNNNALTQFASDFSQYSTSNGTAFGGLNSIGIDKDGFVTANFDNGLSRVIGQVALATFANPDGLKGITGNAYQVSLESGTYNLRAPNTSGAGAIAPSTLEASTVDLSSEFTNLITTQRAYSASSKIITTADQMLSDLINIIR